MRSSSAVGLSIIWVEFDWGTELLTNRQLVNEKLSTIAEKLPEGIVPIMGPISSLMGEIMLLGLRSEKTDPMDLRTIADWDIKRRLEAVSGVAQVVPIGGGVKQIQVKVNPVKLRAFGLTYQEVLEATGSVGRNTTGGFVEGPYQEFLIRNISRARGLEEVKNTTIKTKDGVPISLDQISKIEYAPQVMRGDAGINGSKGVILGIQKQPGVNTVKLTREIESTIRELKTNLPEDIEIIELFKQANFIETAVANVEEALRDGSIFVAIILFLFLVNFRTTAITLTAIPLSVLITFVILKIFGISINTMTLGGLAVAIGELVDDAIVDVENVFRRLRQNHAAENPKSPYRVVYEASSEVRNSIVMATAMVILVFVPLLALQGLEGRFFVPLGIAYVVSILASLVVSLTVTPALCAYLLPKAKIMEKESDGALVAKLKHWDAKILDRVLDRPKAVLGVILSLVVIAGISVFFMGREFLPPFNEGSVTAFVVSPPGTSLSESNRIGAIAENQLLTVPEISITGRRTGRAEQDEHAEGVYNSEIDVELADSGRSREEILHDVREALQEIPGVGIGIGQPIAHRLDHMMSGVQAQIAIKIFGDDLATLREQARTVEASIADVEGLVDLRIEKMTVVPQVQIVPNLNMTKLYGISAGELAEWLENVLGGKVVEYAMQGQRQTAIHVRISDSVRQNPREIENLLVETPSGKKLPLRSLAAVQVTKGPNAINHENGKRRIIVMGNTHGRDLGSVIAEIQSTIKEQVTLPKGYYVAYDGQFKSQIDATRSIAALSVFSLLGIFLILYLYFGSVFFCLQVMLNIPLALIGSVAAVFLTGGVFSIGTLVGFITLCGIASRNGILLISHFLHLLHEEEREFSRETVIQGSLERLVPMLMTALTAALALVPIALSGGETGKEILHPVAVVILGGLLSSTVLDIIVTPTIFWNYARKAAGIAIKNRYEKDDGFDDAA